MATARRVFDVRVVLSPVNMNGEAHVIGLVVQESPDHSNRPVPDIVMLAVGLVTFTESSGLSRLFPVSRILEISVQPYRTVDV